MSGSAPGTNLVGSPIGTVIGWLVVVSHSQQVAIIDSSLRTP